MCRVGLERTLPPCTCMCVDPPCVNAEQHHRVCSPCLPSGKMSVCLAKLARLGRATHGTRLTRAISALGTTALARGSVPGSSSSGALDGPHVAGVKALPASA